MKISSASGLALMIVLCVACGAPVTFEDVSYDERFEDTKLDLYLPDDHATARPLVMLIHGGAWVAGSKSNMQGMAERLARSGYAAASIDYRLLPEGRFPRMFQDVGCALAFLQKNSARYDIDPDRIALLGYSAGGHLAALLGVAWDEPAFRPDCAAGAPRRARASIPGAGVYDLRGNDSELMRDLLGGSPSEVPERYVLGSPMAMVDPGEPPFLLIGGGADWFVDTDQAAPMRDALRAVGGEADLLMLAGTGHLLGPSVDPGEQTVGISIETPEAWLAIADFLARTVGEP
jgi:acetyl esterase/lipase